jgi:hypothetical protein
MARTLPSAVLSAIAANLVRVAFFGEFQFAGGTVRLWTGYGTITWNGHTWTGAGDFAGLSPVDETTEVGAAGLTFTLSGIPSSTLAIALGDAYRGRKCTLWLAILDSTMATVVDAAQVFSGLMDVMKIDDAGETATISLQAESRLIDLGRPRTVRYTDQEQQNLFPGDLGLQYVAKLAEQPIYWGTPTPAAASAPGYSGGGDTVDQLE